MLPDRVSNPGPLTYESGALPIVLRGPVHRCREQSFAIRAYAMSTVGINVVSVHKLFTYRVVSTVRIYREQSYDILQNRIYYHKLEECIARYK